MKHLRRILNEKKISATGLTDKNCKLKRVLGNYLTEKDLYLFACEF